MVNKKIYDYIKGNDANFDTKYLLQMPAVPLYANWTDKKSLYTLYSVVDAAPRWSPVWVPTKKTFSDSYEEFVRSIQLPNPTPAQKAAELKYQALSKQYGDLVEKKKQEWLQYDENQRKQRPNSPASWTTRQKWYELHAADDLSLKSNQLLEAYTSYQNTLDATALIYAKWMRKIDITQPIDIRMPISAEQFNSDENDPTSWTTEPRMPVQFDSVVLEKLKTDGDAQFVTGSPAVTWTFDKNSERREEERKSWGGSASYGPFFHASVSHKETSINFNAAGTYLKFGFFAIAQIPVGPTSNWYSEDLVTKFACGPFKPDVTTTPKDWWGTDGRLSLIPVSVVVAYKPEIEAKLTDEQFRFFESTTSGSGGLSIGPFGIGGGGSSFKQSVAKDSKEGHITVKTVSATPMVIAVLYQRLPGRECK